MRWEGEGWEEEGLGDVKRQMDDRGFSMTDGGERQGRERGGEVGPGQGAR